MRLLVLGGTSFLSHQVAREAVGRGHRVVCAARGRSGAVPEGAELVTLDRDEPGALAPLRGRGFDAAVDVATGALGQVRAALEVLADDVAHWVFVSSINVYVDTATPGQGVDARLHPAVGVVETLDVLDSTVPVEQHAGIKVACEQAVRVAAPGRTLVVRPGIVTGPADPMDRFGYWAARFARGGRAVVPDVPDQPVQHVDVRDLAAFLVTGAETAVTGTYDAVGPVLALGDVLRESAALVGAADLELVPVGPEALREHGVTPWAGPTSLPLWLPPDSHGLLAHDPAPALAAGLPARPFADVIRTALDDERARGLDRTRAAGLTEDEERAVLRALGKA